MSFGSGRSMSMENMPRLHVHTFAYIYIHTCSYMSTIHAHVCTFLIDARQLNRRSNIYFAVLESGLGFQTSVFFFAGGS